MDRRAVVKKKRLDARHRWTIRPWSHGDYWVAECQATRCRRNPARARRAMYLIPAGEVTPEARGNLTGTKFTLTPLNLALPGT